MSDLRMMKKFARLPLLLFCCLILMNSSSSSDPLLQLNPSLFRCTLHRNNFVLGSTSSSSLAKVNNGDNGENVLEPPPLTAAEKEEGPVMNKGVGMKVARRIIQQRRQLLQQQQLPNENLKYEYGGEGKSTELLLIPPVQQKNQEGEPTADDENENKKKKKKRRREGPKPLTLVHACAEDVVRVCKMVSPYKPAAVDCLQENVRLLSLDCQEWHSDRVECARQIANAQACESCSQICPHFTIESNIVFCMKLIGRDRLDKMLTLGCTDTDFYRSVTKYSVRTRKPIPNIEGEPF